MTSSRFGDAYVSLIERSCNILKHMGNTKSMVIAKWYIFDSCSQVVLEDFSTLFNLRDEDYILNPLRDNVHSGFRLYDLHTDIMVLMLQKPAPYFKGIALVEGEFREIKLTDYRGQYVILLFYPLDFTFVCPTEILAFSDRVGEFQDSNCTVIATSCDSEFCHLAWSKTPRSEGGLGHPRIPILADKSGQIARDYEVFDEETGIPFRGLFIIDDSQVLRQIIINDLSVGRSVDETLRLVKALQFYDENGEVCPANWTPGDMTIQPTPQGASEYFEIMQGKK